ncbi:Bud site selection protein 6 [Psilocybe cubensis]|uniref:Aip3p/Bud6 N-terminal domain-containing protein n=2 Tax=Psilocybe cubensis TaxID=181762 RepID=A0A8H7XVP8_PSICU|nr:Bud site selection protein 6 [Psilocybe cubensis]KAH9479843.1 Bud site selection protein 6 [Psilocybe cubensis]
MSAYYSSSSSYAGAGPNDAPAPMAPINYQTAIPGDVSTAVKDLLTSTKRLQEMLKLWSIEQATEGDVSDLYVQIGHAFNVTITAFAYHHIDLSDLHNIPTELREVLERCLSEDPSPEVLDSYLPDLRKVLFKLLKGLQSRQAAWRASVERREAMQLRTSPLNSD